VSLTHFKPSLGLNPTFTEIIYRSSVAVTLKLQQEENERKNQSKTEEDIKKPTSLLTYLPTYLLTHSLTHSLHGAGYYLKS
jgi:hypothetical protein